MTCAITHRTRVITGSVGWYEPSSPSSAQSDPVRYRAIGLCAAAVMLVFVSSLSAAASHARTYNPARTRRARRPAGRAAPALRRCRPGDVPDRDPAGPSRHTTGRSGSQWDPVEDRRVRLAIQFTGRSLDPHLPQMEIDRGDFERARRASDPLRARVINDERGKVLGVDQAATSHGGYDPRVEKQRCPCCSRSQ